MDLNLLKQFIDDGIAKHKAFAEFKTVIDDAASIDQYAKELKIQADSAKDVIEAKRKELASLSQSLDALKEAFRKQSIEFDATNQKRQSEADARYAQLVQSQQERASMMRSQITALDGQVTKAKEDKAKAEAELSAAKAAAVAAIKAETTPWEDKLAAAKLAYETFIANLPK